MDKELEDLLNSALDDFDQKLVLTEDPTKTKTNTTTASSITIERTNLYVDDIDYEDRPIRTSKPASAGAQSSKPDPNLGFNLNDDNLKLFEDIFNDEKSKESMKQFKGAFDMFQNSTDEKNLLANFQKVMSELVNEETNLDEDDLDEDFENIDGLNFFKNLTAATTQKKEENNSSKSTEKKLQETQTPLQKVLEDMNKNSEKVLKQSANVNFPFGADFLSSLTSSLNNETTGDDDDEGVDGATSMMMQPIISMLFSKEILYPSLKLMLENYDKYIAEKKDKLSDIELNKCLEQKEYIRQMCEVYEKANETDAQEAKTEQLKNILDLLEKCGVKLSFCLYFGMKFELKKIKS